MKPQLRWYVLRAAPDWLRIAVPVAAVVAAVPIGAWVASLASWRLRSAAPAIAWLVFAVVTGGALRRAIAQVSVRWLCFQGVLSVALFASLVAVTSSVLWNVDADQALGVATQAFLEEGVFRCALPLTILSVGQRARTASRAAVFTAIAISQIAFASAHFVGRPVLVVSALGVTEFARLLAAGFAFQVIAGVGGLWVAAIAHAGLNSMASGVVRDWSPSIALSLAIAACSASALFATLKPWSVASYRLTARVPFARGLAHV